VWPCVGEVPTGEIEAGDFLMIPVWIGSIDSPPGIGPMHQRTGLHRVVLSLHSAPGVNPGLETLLPLEQRQSNRFWIQAPWCSTAEATHSGSLPPADRSIEPTLDRHGPSAGSILLYRHDLSA
jgi:hypothetical protein